MLLSTRVDLLFLSAVASTAAVGHYAVAIAVTAVLWLVPSALSDVLFPRIAALSASGEREFRAFVEDKSVRHTVLLVVLALPVLIGPLLLLVVPIYGAAFRPRDRACADPPAGRRAHGRDRGPVGDDRRSRQARVLAVHRVDRHAR